jgi:hypothetical protein
MPDEKLKYPIGKFSPQDKYTPEEIATHISVIEQLPVKLERLCEQLRLQHKLDTPYREGGWTARQVVHHIADSHLNAYIRVKWSLTEDTPLIKAYNEKAWAETYEITSDPSLSVTILKALHAKWVVLLNALTPEDLKKGFIHPETGKTITLDRLIATYAWHGEHHLGHLHLILQSS